ncbi:hypothetical protein OA92_09990 [Marinomonas sp. SBI22]|uniref:hypothetical protein n=1 Tax=unclassified Marinomonas TaxID=196814 RepID=UPI0007AEFC71|nr:MULTISPECIES: hypothetical protein [unclassified Marinomonas]KZM43082.1 hypothetical protein OA92_09990 [Marinomonas sp. SBI22]KZM44653.1 hypothetical protein OA91_09415 [Marinomonas sp. SBI8L]
MAAFNNKQFYILLGVAAVGGFVLYQSARKAATEVIETTKEVGEASVFLGEYYLEQASDYVSSALTLDEFDSKYRHKMDNMNDEQYQRWKTAVQAGEIQNHFKE